MMALLIVLLTLAIVFTIFPLMLEVGMYCGVGEGDQEGDGLCDLQEAWRGGTGGALL